MAKQNNYTSGINGRELVLSMLLEIYRQEEFSHILIRQVLDKYDYLEIKEKAFIKRLTEGTLERTIELDYVINQFSKVPVNKMKPLIRALLRMSTYQLLYMEQIPDAAVCNEAVKLASAHKFMSLKGFVNGVLRSIARGKSEIAYPDRNRDFVTYCSVRYSLPEWMAEHFIREYGEEKAEQICAGLLEERPLTVRMKESLTSEEKDKVLSEWEQQGVKITAHPYLPYAYICEKTEGAKALAGFEEGYLTVQDVSSMLVAEMANIQPGMKILDICAAPGGKSTHAAEKLQGSGQVVSRDISEYKLQFIKENARRQNLTNLQAEVWDAAVLDEEKKEWADVVFCDLPCSGLGVMGKKRDIKYRLNPKNLTDVRDLQRKILENAWQYVKKGGILMYSTCTINSEENEKQVQWLTENFPLEVISMKDRLPKEIAEAESEYGLQLLPGIHPTDGFFIARLRRM